LWCSIGRLRLVEFTNSGIRHNTAASFLVSERGDRAPEVIEVIVSSREQAKQMMAFQKITDGKMFVRPAS